MRIISANLNGIRSAYQKGFLDYLKNADADILCVQEPDRVLRRRDVPDDR